MSQLSSGSFRIVRPVIVWAPSSCRLWADWRPNWHGVKAAAATPLMSAHSSNARPRAARYSLAGTAPCCMDRRYGRTEPRPIPGSHDADVLRASQLQHSVQHADGDGHLARLSPVRLEA